MPGFGSKAKNTQVPVRRFSVEYKHRPPDDSTGEQEQLVETKTVEVPRLKDSLMEKQWIRLVVWNALHSKDCQDKGINQAFIYCAEFEGLFLRLELNNFVDEPSHVLKPPSDELYNHWKSTVWKRFQTLYGFSLDDWLKVHNYN
jgi:hypothetical protein